MELLCICLFGLIAATHSQASSGSKCNFTVVGNGPNADVRLQWQKFPCDQDSATYQLAACLGALNCVNGKTSKPEYLLATGFGMPVLFWTRYDITINATCAGKTKTWQKCSVDTGPGELLPVQHIEVNADHETATVSVLAPNPETQNVADYIEIIFCRAPAVDCKIHKLKPTEKETKMKNLIPGVSYNVTARMVKNSESGNEYESASQTKIFVAIPPVPPQITGLQMSQVLFTKTVKLSWSEPVYTSGKLKYKIDTICAEHSSSEVQKPEFEFAATSIRKYETDCSVKVATCVQAPTPMPVCSEAAEKLIKFHFIREPEKVDVQPYENIFYNVTITIPADMAALRTLESQVTDQSGKYSERFTGSVTTIAETRFDQRITRKARFCIGDSCGEEHEFSFTADTGSPGEVSSLDVQVVDATILRLKWGAPKVTNGPIDGYQVDILVIGVNEPKTVFRSSSENYLDYKADDEYTLYDIRVRAFNVGKLNKSLKKDGPWVYTEAVTDGTVPPPPKGLEIAGEGVSPRLQWQAAPHAKFVVKWFRIIASSNRSSIESFSQTPRIEFSTLRAFTDYRFEISSCLSKDVKSCGKPASFEAQTPVGYPSTPTVELVKATSTELTIRWTIPAETAGPINGYEYAYSEKSSGLSPMNWVSSDGVDRSATLGYLIEDTEYQIHVRAFNLDVAYTPLRSAVGVLVASTNPFPRPVSPELIVVMSLTVAVLVVVLVYVAYRRIQKARRPTTPYSAEVQPSPAMPSNMEEIDL